MTQYRTIGVCGVVGCALAVGAVMAQPAAPAKPASEQAPPNPDAKPQTPAAGYPSTKTVKKLFANNDLRGKAAPKLVVEEWYGTKEPEMKGKTLLIDFWFIGCPPCRALIPELEAWQEKFKDDLVVVGLTSMDSAKELAKFEDLRGAKIKYPIARDGQGRTGRDVGVQGYPHVMIVSSDGIVRWQGFPLSGEERLTEQVVEQIVSADKAARAKGAAAGDKKKDATPEPKPAETKPEPKK